MQVDLLNTVSFKQVAASTKYGVCMRAVMIDLETMSSHMDAAIVAIGAVAFDPRGSSLLDMLSVSIEGQPDTCFYTNVQLQSCLNAGLKVSGDTIMWWLQQSQEARDAISSTPSVAIWSALYKLLVWIEHVKPEQVWAHANFDLSILDTAYKACGWSKVPWKYYNARDVRTIYDLAYSGEKVPNIPETNKHHALYDAARQAIGVQICYRKLGV